MTRAHPPAATEVAAAFSQALDHHRAGRIADAEAAYRAILALQSAHFDSLHLLGVIHHQRGEHARAVELIDAALQVNPGSAAALSNRGTALKELQQFEQALASYDGALALKPESAEIHFSRSRALEELGRRDEALAGYDRAISLRPGYTDALINRGSILQELGRLSEAVASYDAALKINPASPQAHNNRGTALKGMARLDDALASYDCAIALRPDYAEAHLNRGNVLRDLSRREHALASYDRAIEIQPTNSDAFYNRGVALTEMERLDEALAAYDRAIALRPEHAQALHNRGNILAGLGRLDEAIASLDGAVRHQPDHADAFNSRGNALATLGRHTDAIASYDRAIGLKPDFAAALYNRGMAFAALNRLGEAIGDYERAMAIDPALPYLEGNLLHLRMHVCDWRNFECDCAHLLAAVADGAPASLPFALLATPASPSHQLTCAATYVATTQPPLPPLWHGERYAHDRIRVAYLSADFHEHVTAQLMVGLFERHDRTRFETIAISFGRDDGSAMRKRLTRCFDRFIDVRTQGDQTAAELVRTLEVDIAVDLKGFTQNARTGILARRPAPVQVNYLGFPGTMAASYIDYILVDRFVAPQDRHDDFSEKVVCLPDSYYPTSYREIEGSRTVPSRTQAGLPEAGFVFCGFNNNYKITPDVFDVWMRLLRHVDGSVLWLLEGNASAPSNLRREAERRGIAGDRLIFAPKTKLVDHLARHRLADLFHDTLYYNAHTTASDALWAGLPVVTFPGTAFASRVAGSLLDAVGLDELITGSLDDYEALALALSRDPARLADVRQRLSRNRDGYPAFDTARLTRHIEAAYATMWERSQRGEKPAGFLVSPVD